MPASYAFPRAPHTRRPRGQFHRPRTRLLFCAQGALAGGFGITGRLISLGLRSTLASPVFSYYALSQSLYSRWIARGKTVTFPKNTRIEVSFGER